MVYIILVTLDAHPRKNTQLLFQLCMFLVWYFYGNCEFFHHNSFHIVRVFGWSIHSLHERSILWGVSNSPADPVAQDGRVDQEGPQPYIILNCGVSSSGLDSLFMPEGSVRNLEVTLPIKQRAPSWPSALLIGLYFT